ncbi:MAG TPA: prephenate dehydrogenase/arogenate dehydrogenase family protein [Chthonomonadaceae bacterium]|nr:prephenate dehydrogenase/arogenate dehydrogenase family protein [Chthonomonadaceae bacterium]
MTDEADFRPFACVAIVGVGLMGGSLGQALRARGLARRVLGVDREAGTLEKAVALGAIDAGSLDIAEAMREADGVVVAVPVGILPSLLETMAPHVRPDALITDLGSTKARIVETGTRLFGPRFVGGHPMAGSEESGITAAHADLFTGAAWAVVRPEPFDFASDLHAARLAALVSALGGRPIALDAERHDRLVALVSHLPHVLSFAFARTVGADEAAEQARQMAGGSFRDMIRVSAADPSLWRDIFLDNRAALLESLAAFQTQLYALQQALETADSAHLLSTLTSLCAPSPSNKKAAKRSLE